MAPIHVDQPATPTKLPVIRGLANEIALATKRFCPLARKPLGLAELDGRLNKIQVAELDSCIQINYWFPWLSKLTINLYQDQTWQMFFRHVGFIGLLKISKGTRVRLANAPITNPLILSNLERVETLLERMRVKYVDGYSTKGSWIREVWRKLWRMV